jgi:hypothetical protein
MAVPMLNRGNVTRMPCLVDVQDDLCWLTRGYRGGHEPRPAPHEIPEISGPKLHRLNRRFGDLMVGRHRWWQRKARCPKCRAVITAITLGALAPQALIATYGSKGPGAVLHSEYPVEFGPCGHQFRRVTRRSNFPDTR